MINSTHPIKLSECEVRRINPLVKSIYFTIYTTLPVDDTHSFAIHHHHIQVQIVNMMRYLKSEGFVDGTDWMCHIEVKPKQ